MDQQFTHTTVMLNEAVNALLAVRQNNFNDSYTFVDGTFGRGGHSKLLLENLSPKDKLIVFDKDPQAIVVANQLADNRVTVKQQSFAEISQLPAGSIDGVLLDIGVSSPQLDDPQRGFSFRADGPLDMRMNPSQGLSAAQWLAKADYQQIKQVITNYGEERFASSIAKAIIEYRETKGALATTSQLAELVATKVKTREFKQHPATRTFQALRIYINGELDELSKALKASLSLLKTGGCLAVISFHSLEDRIVKQFLNKYSKDNFDRANPLASNADNLLFDGVKRIRATPEEVEKNPRSRSAILRIAYRNANKYVKEVA